MCTCMIAIAASLPIQKANAQQEGTVTFQMFYDELSPYGQWIDDATLGYVWAPTVGNDFRPYYSDGHWVMTDGGNMWVSDYSWGWAPFHYGRWTFDSNYGWIWIPDTVWAPAWVTWRSDSNYYGWAPMGPGVTVEMSLSGYNTPDDWWVFIAPTYLYHPQWRNFYNGHSGNTAIVRQTSILRNSFTDTRNNRTYNSGPRADQVKQFTHTDIPVYKVYNEAKPGKAAIQNNQINVYRPSVGNKTAEIPTKVTKAVRPINGTVTTESARKQANNENNVQPVEKHNETPLLKMTPIENRNKIETATPNNSHTTAIPAQQSVTPVKPVENRESQLQKSNSHLDQQIKQMEQKDRVKSPETNAAPTSQSNSNVNPQQNRQLNVQQPVRTQNTNGQKRNISNVKQRNTPPTQKTETKAPEKAAEHP